MESLVIPILAGIGLLLGTVSGFVMHRSDFCVAGMFRDLFLFRSLFGIRSLLLLVVSSMLLFEATRQAGLLKLYPFPLIGAPSLTIAAGGLLFGIGMVLAGGCVVGTLYRIGSGSILSLVVFAGLLAGSALYAEFHPYWASLSRATLIFPGCLTVPQLLGTDPPVPILLVALPLLFILYRTCRSGGLTRPAYAEGALPLWQAALVLAAVGLVSAVAVGMPLGLTTAYAKLAGYLESVVRPEQFSRLVYFTLTPLDYQLPIVGIRMTGGPGPVLDAIALIQFPLIAGIILGSACSTFLLKEFRFSGRAPIRQYISAAAGGVLMGLASRMSAGCNIWHLFGGLPILSLQSLLFLLGLIPGTYLGSMLLVRLVIRQ